MSQEQEEVADCSSDYKLRLVLQRRGLALEMADLLSYDQHERLVEILFSALMKEPKAGKLKVSREQLLEADQEVFLQLSRATRAGIRRTQGGARPLDVALPVVLCDPDFRATPHQLPAFEQRSVCWWKVKRPQSQSESRRRCWRVTEKVGESGEEEGTADRRSEGRGKESED